MIEPLHSASVQGVGWNRTRRFFMKRLCLVILLLLYSGPAYSEWMSLFATEEGTVYVDRDTVRRKGELVKMWYLFDFKVARTVGGDSNLSSKLQIEFDCGEERMRKLASTYFSGNMGSGKANYTISDPSKWAPVEPASTGEALWKVACGAGH
jgi:hypothetical protein